VRPRDNTVGQLVDTLAPTAVWSSLWRTEVTVYANDHSINQSLGHLEIGVFTVFIILIFRCMFYITCDHCKSLLGLA